MKNKQPRYNKKFLPFKKARSIIRSLKIPSENQWWVYSSSERPSNIPASPRRVYCKDWIGWRDWLGNYGRKYRLNEYYFNKWSSNMAYILGFWWTDGNTDGKSRFNISQHKDRIYILKQILKEIGSDHPIYYYKNDLCVIDLHSKTLIAGLKQKGGISNKSLKIDLPHIPAKYLPDFIKGLWDGDGSIWYSNNKKAYLSSFSSGSLLLIKHLHINLKNNLGVKGRIITKITPKGNKIRGVATHKTSITYVLNFGVNDTRRIRNFIYSGRSNIGIIEKHTKFKNAGEITEARRTLNFWDYKKSKNFVQKLNIKSVKGWRKWAKINRHSKIPCKPEQHYIEWTNWYEWLGIEKS